MVVSKKQDIIVSSRIVTLRIADDLATVSNFAELSAEVGPNRPHLITKHLQAMFALDTLRQYEREIVTKRL